MDGRSQAQLLEHYQIESALAARLMAASREERKALYVPVHEELYAKLKHHPLLTRPKDAHSIAKSRKRKMALVKRYLTPQTTFLEVGPGDCTFAAFVAFKVREVIAVDITDKIADPEALKGITFRLCDSSSIPVAATSVDVVYSNQLMEHLHPDDAIDQLKNIYRALKATGVYICLTPSRLCGPHDISKHFSPVARGFHLREWSYSELIPLFKQAGFRRLRAFMSLRGRYIGFPAAWALRLERLIGRLPHAWRKRSVLRNLLGVTLAATK